MELWLVLLLYIAGLSMVIAEALTPGAVMGIIGAVLLVVATVFGFGHHWGIGAAQIAVVLVVAPAAFVYGMKRIALKTTLDGTTSYAKDYSEYLGREGETHTELRPAGTVVVDGRKIDVVTGGEPIEKGRRVRVVKVEGNRIVVRGV